MNKFYFLAAFLLSASAFAAGPDYQKLAEDKFIGETSVVKLTGQPLHEVEIKFPRAITKVLVNNVDNPYERVKSALFSINDSLDGDATSEKEIYLYAGNDVMNCYATYINGELASLTKCSKIYPEKVSGYGNY